MFFFAVAWIHANRERVFTCMTSQNRLLCPTCSEIIILNQSLLARYEQCFHGVGNKIYRWEEKIRDIPHGTRSSSIQPINWLYREHFDMILVLV